jgi:hypothetical protein
VAPKVQVGINPNQEEQEDVEPRGPGKYSNPSQEEYEDVESRGPGKY